MVVKKFKAFIFENYYRGIGFTKENTYYLMKHETKKDCVRLTTALIKNYLVLVILKSIIYYFREVKKQNWLNDQNQLLNSQKL